MRKTIGNHQQLLQLSTEFRQHKLETNEKFQQVFMALEAPSIKDKQGVFFDGQTYDAYDFVNSLIKKAKSSIVLIDNFIGDTVITQLTKKNKNVAVTLLSKNITKAHDRFTIIDTDEVYHLGASLKDLRKKWFAFSKLEANSVTIVASIKELI